MAAHEFRFEVYHQSDMGVVTGLGAFARLDGAFTCAQSNLRKCGLNGEFDEVRIHDKVTKGVRVLVALSAIDPEASRYGMRCVSMSYGDAPEFDGSLP